jgi:hypothetical protein
MGARGKRRRVIVVSDGEDSDVIDLSTNPTRKVATPVSKASSPFKSFPSSPPKDAKFWVESKPPIAPASLVLKLTAASPALAFAIEARTLILH